MYSLAEIKSRSKLVVDTVNMVLQPRGLNVGAIYLIGSYASGRANEYSDIDYLVQLEGGKRPLEYPNFDEIMEIKNKIHNDRIHAIYGTLEAQQSMCRKDPIKYAWKEL